VTPVHSEMLMQRRLGWLVVWAGNHQHHRGRGPEAFITLVRTAGLHLDGAPATVVAPLRIQVLLERRSL
jgi:hypothetical protein